MRTVSVADRADRRGTPFTPNFRIDPVARTDGRDCPGEPRNGIPLRELESGAVRRPNRQSPTGARSRRKKSDMDMYASVPPPRLRAVAGRAGGQALRAVRLVRTFESTPRTRLPRHVRRPACYSWTVLRGVIRAGPAWSARPDEVTVSAINSNFPGRRSGESVPATPGWSSVCIHDRASRRLRGRARPPMPRPDEAGCRPCVAVERGRVAKPTPRMTFGMHVGPDPSSRLHLRSTTNGAVGDAPRRRAALSYLHC